MRHDPIKKLVAKYITNLPRTIDQIFIIGLIEARENILNYLLSTEFARKDD